DVSGIRPADVMVVSVCPAPEDHLAGQLFSGSVGVLLDNMLSAIGLTPEQAHKTVWLKTADIAARPDEAQIQAALPQMQAELAASRARAVLLLGQAFTPQQAAVQTLSAQARCFHIPHPARLLRQPQLKRQAWEELQKLQQFLEQAV
ncbi:uracil-DNA glycosylase family protein, partial [Neisseria sp.]